MAKQDMGLPKPPELEWNGGDQGSSLDGIIEYGRFLATEAHQWYVNEKRRKRFYAKGLRFFAILLTALAGIIPILTDVWVRDGGEAMIHPALASVFLAVAGTLVLYDRFFGFSTGWIRYTQSMMEIRVALNLFDINISKAKLNPAEIPSEGGGERAPSRAETVLQECSRLIESVNQAIQEETNRWDTEFRDALKRVEAETAAVRERALEREKEGAKAPKEDFSRGRPA